MERESLNRSGFDLNNDKIIRFEKPESLRSFAEASSDLNGIDT